MKPLLALVSVFALLLFAMSFANTSSTFVFAGIDPTGTGEGEITRAPEGEPICFEDVPDEGDDEGEGGKDDGEDGYDDGDSDDPSDDVIIRDDVGSAGDDDDDDGREYWDGFDHDDEEDDCQPPHTPNPYDCGDMTAPGAYLFQHVDYEGYCFRFDMDVDQLPSPPDNDSSSLKLVGFAAVELCDDPFRGGSCLVYTGDDDNFVPEGHNDTYSSLYFSDIAMMDEPGDDEPGPAATAASDANCDGGTNAADALAVVLYVSGAGSGCTGAASATGVAGDADCSGDVSNVDAALILREAAGLAEAAC